MKKLSAFTLSLLCAGSSMAEETLPYGITPLNGEIRLLYRPGFVSTCIERNESDTKDEPSETVTELFLDSAGQFKFEMKMDNFSAIADVNFDGSAILAGSLKFIAEDQATNEFSKEMLKNEFFSKLFKDLEKAFIVYSPIGKYIKQNSDLSAANLCEIFPGGKSKVFSTFSRKVSGIAQIHGRPSLILKSDIKTTCTLDKLGQMAISGYAWESIDLQSGLNSDGGGQMLLKMGSEPEVNMKTFTSCVITDATQAIAASSRKSLEERLTELKGLMEKGLITQDQYEQKRADILKAL